MTAILTTVNSVEPLGDNLSVVKVDGIDANIIANKTEDGSFRWAVGEVCVYVNEGSIIPEDVLKERGYWDDVKDRGLLDGGARNRVKMKKMAGVESRGLIFKTHSANVTIPVDGPEDAPVHYLVQRGQAFHSATVGEDVAEFLSIEDFAA